MNPAPPVTSTDVDNGSSLRFVCAANRLSGERSINAHPEARSYRGHLAIGLSITADVTRLAAITLALTQPPEAESSSIADQESIRRECPTEFVFPLHVMRVIGRKFAFVCFDGFIRTRSPPRKNRVSIEH